MHIKKWNCLNSENKLKIKSKFVMNITPFMNNLNCYIL